MTISITVLDRSTITCAPDSVRFMVDLSSSIFDTAGPGEGEVYDARLQNLYYAWDFGDADGTLGDLWQVPQNMLPQHRRRTKGRGCFTAHMYLTPGTYTVRVLVIEPSSGKVEAATTSVEITDADTAYSGTNTICVNPVGDSDFSGKPTGAEEVNADSLYTADSAWTSRQGGSAKRWLFKRGGTYDVKLTFGGSDVGGHYFGAYGTGERPIITLPTSGQSFDVDLAYDGTPSTPADLRLDGIKFTGGFDPTTTKTQLGGTGLGTTPIRTDACVNVIWSDCVVDGNYASIGYFGKITDRTKQMRVHVDGMDATNFGGQYPFFTDKGNNLQSSFALTGSRIVNPGDALATDSSRSIVRHEEWPLCYIAGNELFHSDKAQPVLKLVNSPETELGHIAVVHSNNIEGNDTGVVFGSNLVDPTNINKSVTINASVFENVMTAGYSTFEFFNTQCGGVVIHSNLLNMPATTKDGGGDLTQILRATPITAGGTPTDETYAAPILLYGNTCINHRTSAQNGSVSVSQISLDGSPTFSGSNAANNILHSPNYNTPVEPYAPLTEIVLWAPENVGMRDADTLVLATAQASPVDDIQDAKPDTGSSAISGYSAGNVSSYDIIGRRHAATPDLGCWRVS